PAAAIELGAVLREQTEVFGSSPAANGVHEERALVRVGTGGEQEPDVLRVVVIECVRERVRALRLGAAVEERLQTVRRRMLDRVVERIAELRRAVVDVRTRVDEEPDQ